MTTNELSGIAYEAGFKIHKTLGPGLLESAYEECLCYELRLSGYNCERQKGLPLVYENVVMEIGYRTDILLEGKLIIEVKAIESIANIHMAQMITYLKLSDCKLGLIMNFNTPLFKHGVKRVIHGQL